MSTSEHSSIYLTHRTEILKFEVGGPQVVDDRSVVDVFDGGLLGNKETRVAFFVPLVKELSRAPTSPANM